MAFCFDVGVTTRRALLQFAASRDARTSADCDENASGNGSIMRLAPVAIKYCGLLEAQPEELAQRAAESSIPTHASPQCLSACRYLAALLAGLIVGHERADVLSSDWNPVLRIQAAERLHPLVRSVADGSFRKKQPPEIRGSGWVVQSLEAALWAFHNATSFEEAVLKAVNLGDDADTTGAVCGQLAGAYWGASRIPERWRKELAQVDMIESITQQLCEI